MRKTIGMRASLLGLAVVCVQACALPWDEPEDDVSSSEHRGTVVYGNAAALPGNAAALPGNAAALPGNAAALPGNGASIAVAEANALIIQPRSTTTPSCGGYTLSQWEFAASYRCNGRIHTSDVRVWPFGSSSAQGVNLGAGLCSRCGAIAPKRVYLPAKLGYLGQTGTKDVVLELDFAGPSEYDCTKHDYSVMVYRLSVSTDDCASFSNLLKIPYPYLVTAVPAPQKLFSTASSMAAKGAGWGLVVPATTDSAVFKSAHYTKMVLTFHPTRSDGWTFQYPTTGTTCDQTSSCLSGASMLFGYALALANLAPVQDGTTLFGLPGTLTGVPTWISIVTPNGTLNKTYLEVQSRSMVENYYVTPGDTERTATPYTYDAVFAPGAHKFSSARAAYGPDVNRIDPVRRRLCNDRTDFCLDPNLNSALITNYNNEAAVSPKGSALRINNLYSALGVGAPFIATAMPAPKATASCTTEVEQNKKQPVDLPAGPRFCIPPPPQPPMGSGTGTGTGSGP